jgi:hypothetical protein
VCLKYVREVVNSHSNPTARKAAALQSLAGGKYGVKQTQFITAHQGSEPVKGSVNATSPVRDRSTYVESAVVVPTIVQATHAGSTGVVENEDGGGIESLISDPEGAISPI